MAKQPKLSKRYKWQQASERIVRSYVAELNQTDLNPPRAFEIYNDTGIEFTYSYVSDGIYLVRSSKPIFMQLEDSKTVLSITNPAYIEFTGMTIIAYPVLEDAFVIMSSNLTVPANNMIGVIAPNVLEVRIYN